MTAASSPTPPLTVAITVYNRERYLGDAIESVLASRYGDFELLIVDNSSTDRSQEIARDWARRDRRIRLAVNKENIGQRGNRNRAIELTRTPYLKYHDSDDLLYPHALGLMMECLESEPRAAFGLSAGTTWSGGPCPMLLSPADCYRREFLGRGMFFAGPAGALFRTEPLRRLGGFPDRGVALDYCFWLAACRQEHVLLLPADLFWYRIHPGQELQSAGAALAYARAHGEAWRALGGADCPLAGAELEQARRNWAFTLFKLNLRDLRAGRWRAARQRLASAEVGIGGWLRYLRRPRRDPHAGTPHGEDGDFLVPQWLRATPDRLQPSGDEVASAALTDEVGRG